MLKRLALALTLLAAPVCAEPDPADWPAVLAEARGQTVWFHAWGGDARINAYIDWAGARMRERFDITVMQVKLSDTAEAVARVRAEKAAGRETGGAVDLVWINGENFAAMQAEGLLWRPWVTDLPNWVFADAANPALTVDFTLPTEGREMPWSLARLVFYHDAARLPDPPRSPAALLDWAAAHPGRFTYPQPPDFLGTTFLKQMLVSLTADPARLARPPGAEYAAVTAPLWDWLDAITPHLWRQGRAYPASGPQMRRLLADGEITIGFAFDPNEAAAAVAAGELPPSVRSFVPEGGTLGNASFLAIPFNASARAGALVLADFLLSPEAQARKADPEVWGAASVLDIAALPEAERSRFATLRPGPATLSPEALGPVLPEPHPGWVARLEADWARRYGVTP